MQTGWGNRVHSALRSMNGDLVQGMTDGSCKKFMRDRGGIVEGTSTEDRRDLSEIYAMSEDLSGYLPITPFVKMRG